MPVKPNISTHEKLYEDDLSKILLETAYKQPTSTKYENLDALMNKRRGIFDTAIYTEPSSGSKSGILPLK